MTSPPNADELPEESSVAPPPVPDAGWAPPGPPTTGPPLPQGPPPSPQQPPPLGPPAGPRAPLNKVAVVALVVGVLGGTVVAVALSIAALSQIRRRRERGKGLAIGALGAAAAWALVIVFGVAVTVGEEAGKGDKASPFQLYPNPGQCFDFAGARGTADLRVVPCAERHDGEMLMVFALPESGYPGEKEVVRLGTAGCEQRVLARYKTRYPVDNGESYALYPQRVAWRLGDRKVHCAIAVNEGGKLTGPIGPGPSATRGWDEVRVGECFSKPAVNGTSITLADCEEPHGAQLTHQFALPGGAFPGDTAAEKKADNACTRHWSELFGQHPPPVAVQQWYKHPDRASWDAGDRKVQCYVTAKKGALKRSVLPD